MKSVLAITRGVGRVRKHVAVVGDVKITDREKLESFGHLVLIEKHLRVRSIL